VGRYFVALQLGARYLALRFTPILQVDLATGSIPSQLGRVVVDKTGLTGEYDFELKWTPDLPAGGPVDAAPAGPSLFTALEEQLGLRLQTGRAPLDVLVIDKVEKPSEN